MKKGTNQKVIDQLNAAFDKLIPTVPEGIQREIMEAFKDYYIKSATDIYLSEKGEFYRSFPTFMMQKWVKKKCSILRYHLRKMEKVGLIEFLQSRSNDNSLSWSINELEGFQKKYSDVFELINK